MDVTSSDAELTVVEVVRRNSHAYTVSATDLATCEVDLANRSISVRAARGQDQARIAYFVADVVLPRVASLEGRCLHAAALDVDGRAFALIGPTGAGKSTLAGRLCLQGASLLGDDCALVRDGLVHPAFRPSRLWPDAAMLLGLPASAPDATGKISLAESHGVMRGASAVPLREVLVVDSERRKVGVMEALGLLMNEAIRLVIPTPLDALDKAVEFVREFGPRQTIPRDAILDDLRAL